MSDRTHQHHNRRPRSPEHYAKPFEYLSKQERELYDSLREQVDEGRKRLKRIANDARRLRERGRKRWVYEEAAKRKEGSDDAN